MNKIKKGSPLVSIVTPSHNSGKYIEECIESILNQDYVNIEHIIQDAQSTDSTKEILKKYSSKKYNGRIRIFSEPDNGQSDGLNKALQKAEGEVILVLNADDMLMANAVSWGVEQLKMHPEAGVVYGDAYIINENGEITNIYKAHSYDFEKLLCVELVPPAQAAFIRRSALEAVGFWADATVDTCPDFEMWVRISRKFPMKHVWGVITKYRHHKTPQLDSKKRRTVERFVKAKREVMDRLFNSPKTPRKIKKLRRRAYGSLYTWAASTALELKDYPSAAQYLVKAFLSYPKLNNFMRLIMVMKDSPLLFIKSVSQMKI